MPLYAPRSKSWKENMKTLIKQNMKNGKSLKTKGKNSSDGNT
jgi:hypothetical protein